MSDATGLQQLCHWRCAGVYALQEITAILDPKLATHKMGRDIMEKLQSYSKKAPTPCNGLKMEIETNPMTPIKSITWRRSSVAESGADMNSSDAEDVPYVMLYFTVSSMHTAASACQILHMGHYCTRPVWTLAHTAVRYCTGSVAHQCMPWGLPHNMSMLHFSFIWQRSTDRVTI